MATTFVALGVGGISAGTCVLTFMCLATNQIVVSNMRAVVHVFRPGGSHPGPTVAAPSRLTKTLPQFSDEASQLYVSDPRGMAVAAGLVSMLMSLSRSAVPKKRHTVGTIRRWTNQPREMVIAVFWHLWVRLFCG